MRKRAWRAREEAWQPLVPAAELRMHVQVTPLLLLLTVMVVLLVLLLLTVMVLLLLLTVMVLLLLVLLLLTVMELLLGKAGAPAALAAATVRAVRRAARRAVLRLLGLQGHPVQEHLIALLARKGRRKLRLCQEAERERGVMEAGLQVKGERG